MRIGNGFDATLVIGLTMGIAAASHAQSPPIQFTPCKVAGGTIDARCGSLSVLEDRAMPSGSRIDIGVIVVPARSHVPASSAIMLFAGGPGQTNTDLGPLAAQLTRARDEHDVLLVDFRGTGRSAPLKCDWMRKSPTAQELFDDAFDSTRVAGCLVSVAQRPLALYTLDAAVDDVDDVRAALGYDRIDVAGWSYGTRMALLYLRRHEQHVRTIALNSVASPTLKPPLYYARDAQAALDGLARLCASDATCHDAFPKFDIDIRGMFARLDKAPVTVDVVDSATGRAERVVVDKSEFAESFRALSYLPTFLERVPWYAHEAAKGNFAPIVARMVAFARTNGFGIPMAYWLTVTCSYDVQFIEPREIGPVTRGTYLGDFRIRKQQSACARWPTIPVSNDYRQSGQYKIPALLVSGSIDPVTPPRWADEVATSFPNVRRVVIRGASHSPTTKCVFAIMDAFLVAGTADGLETSCAAGQVPLSFYAPDNSTVGSAWRTRYVDLHVRVLPSTPDIVGDVRLVFSTTTRATDLALDVADSLRVDSTRIGIETSAMATVARTPGKMLLESHRLASACPPQGAKSSRSASCEVEVWYHARPSRRAVGFSAAGAPFRAASFGLPNSAREWWPTLDDPAQKADSADIWITTSDGLTAASNGRLVSQHTNVDGTATAHWSVRSPIYADVVSFAIANYVVERGEHVSRSGQHVPLEFVVFPEDSAKAALDFSIVDSVLTYYETVLGTYPFSKEKYGIAEMERRSFREHQTLTSLGAAFITGTGESDDVIAHEIAHQWFGNSVTLQSWHDIWLNESLAEFMAWRWLRHSGRGHELDANIRGADTTAYAGAIARADSGGLATMFGPLTFQKGPLVLMMLEDLIGEPAMTRALQRYVAQNRYGFASRGSLQRACEAAYGGRPLSWFFEQWLDRSTVPDLVVSLSKQDVGRDVVDVTIRIEQRQPEAPFRLPLNVIAKSNGNYTRKPILVTSKQNLFHVRFVGRPDSIYVDVGRIPARN